nr:type II toxin-antitoxin system VapC family toxin [Siccirubricoccus soli]
MVDTNLLIDLFEGDPRWAPWSAKALSEAAAVGPLLINDVVFAELSVGFSQYEACEVFLAELRIEVAPTPRAALFAAGKAFQAYRRQGGSRTGVLPDFFIGAHAAVAGLPLLTRDPRRYRAYFPDLALIAP